MSTLKKIAFVDRDGTLIVEPKDAQIDTLEKLELADGVINAMLRLRDAGYRFIMVSNQDGLGTPGYPQAAWDTVQAALLKLFKSQGITFDAIKICPHFENDGCTCRKPHLGLVREFLTAGLDLERSCVIGDRETDLALAKNMGLKGWRLDVKDSASWDVIVREILALRRTGRAARKTKETDITAFMDLDGSGKIEIATGIGFLDHMLEQVAKHGGFDLTLKALGDLHIDQHHTVEDAALVLGEALRRALGDKSGVGRFGFLLPMDEAEAQVSLDLSGRPFVEFSADFGQEKIGELETEMLPHFFRSFADAAGMTLHISARGANAHHIAEACFKGLGRALRMAVTRTGGGLPSTKGTL